MLKLRRCRDPRHEVPVEGYGIDLQPEIEQLLTGPFQARKGGTQCVQVVRIAAPIATKRCSWPVMKLAHRATRPLLRPQFRVNGLISLSGEVRYTLDNHPQRCAASLKPGVPSRKSRTLRLARRLE